MRDLEFEIKGKDRTAPAFDSAEARAKRFNTELGNSSAGLNMAATAAKAFAAAFTITAIEGFARYVRGVVTDVADMVDLADKVGVGVESLQRLQYGFEQAGVSAADTATILTKWSKNIGDAYTSGGKLATILKANGISLTDSEGHLRSSVDLMRSYADLIANAGSDQERMTLATTAFGKSGDVMVLALRDGSKAFDELMQSADEAGGVLDDKIARRAAEIDDAFGKMWHNFEINSQSAILHAVDGIDRLMASSSTWLSELDKKIQNTLFWKQGAPPAWVTGGGPAMKDIGLLEKDRRPDMSPIGQRINDAFDTTQTEDSARALILQRRLQELYGKHTVIPDDTPTRKTSTAAAKQQESAYDGVIRKLDEERELLGLNATDQRILIEQRRAGVEATSAEGAAIAAKVKMLEAEKAAQERVKQSIEDQKQIVSGAMTDLRAALADGSVSWSEWGDIAVNALNKVADKLQDRFIDGLFADGGFALLEKLLGIGAGSDAWSGMRTPSAGASRLSTAIGKAANGNSGNSGHAAASKIDIHNYSSAKVSVKESRDQDGGRKIDVMMDDVMAANVARPGSQTSKALKGRFGVSSQLVKR